MGAAPRATRAISLLALSPAEQAAVAAELAGLSARVAALAARLDRLHTAFAVSGEPAERTQVVAASISPGSARPAERAAAGQITASEARPSR